ncbi:alpha/beta fold hydrolase [Crossiella cryophila]|uniref:Pimeloyl-ACP methyl ester carboxylesterase n=1 Tax=Crossiella cryophila TaxID=43355 RepID=A0A7W7CF52_9PSEU|nr:alpha/beta hydrolase [Crossiella cryophila]MBB4680051.1 pimeloyl-ACP methyl ester carboxylesterase [Crossiella cryophila]
MVLLAGFARPGAEAVRWQVERITHDLPALLRPLARVLFTRHMSRSSRTNADVVRVTGIPVNARWMRELRAHDPRPALAAIGLPVLAITEDKDIQVGPADLDEIRGLVPGGAEIHRIPDLAHLLIQVSDWLARKLDRSG